MHLGRAQVSTVVTPPVSSISFSHDSSLFAIAGEAGYEVWSTWPLRLLRRRELRGTLHMALPLAGTPLLALQGGGPSPLYPPNKVILYHDGLGKAIAELEFGERIRGIISRPGGLLVALLRRTIWYEFGVGKPGVPGFWLEKVMEWATAVNETGLMSVSTAPGSSTLALPGRQPGHVQLIHLPVRGGSSVEPASFRSPILLCHTHPLSALTCSPDGKHLATASERGTLIRVWDAAKGRLERELRRGMDRVEMWGLDFDDAVDSHVSKGGRVLGWSDKGTVHVWLPSESAGASKTSPSKHGPSLQTLISRNLPKYFSSETSKLQYHLPRKNPHAFSSVASAATAVPGFRPKSEYGQTNEIDLGDMERFVVCWVTVENKPDTTGSTQVGMRTREDRLSFSSDTTATPHLRFDKTPSQRTHSKKTPSTVSPTSLPSIERQIIIVTHGGDWYRLRLPELRQSDYGELGERSPSNTECELVEYRRLGIGGGGW